MDLITEGMRTGFQACTLALIIPGLAAVLAAQRTAPLAATGYLSAVAVVVWARTARLVTPTTDASLLFSIAVIGGLALIWWQAKRGNPLITVGGGAVIGFVAGWLWPPCGGVHFNDLVRRGASESVELLVPSAAYVLGLTVSLLVVVLVPFAIPRLARLRDSTAAGLAGVALGAGVAVTIAVGSYSEILDELARRNPA